MLGYPGLDNNLGAYRAAQVKWTSVWVVCGGKISTRRKAGGLLLVLHLSSDWLRSPSAPPYKCQASQQLGCLRHPELLVRTRLAEPCQAIRISGARVST